MAIMLQDDDALIALGLPHAILYGLKLPRHDTWYAAWSVMAIDRLRIGYVTFAGLSLELYGLQRKGLIKNLRVKVPKHKHLVLAARWQLTHAGERTILQALDNDEDE